METSSTTLYHLEDLGMLAIGAGLWETVSMAKKRTKLDKSQRQSDRSEKRLNGTRREAAKKNAREDVNQAVERIVRK